MFCARFDYRGLGELLRTVTMDRAADIFFGMSADIAVDITVDMGAWPRS